MKTTITLTLETEGISRAAMEPFTANMCSHIYDTFNDDGSVKTISWHIHGLDDATEPDHTGEGL